MLPDLKSEHKSKTDSNRSHPSSSKASSRLSSNSLTCSYARGTYLSIIKKRITIEQAKFLALPAEERSKRNLKLLEKSLELEKKRFLSEAAEGRDKAALVELETKHNETTFSSSYRTSSKSAKSLNIKIADSLFLYDKNRSKAEISCENILQPLPKPINSDTSELLKPLLQIKTENSQWKNNEIIKGDTNFKVQKRESIDSFIDHLIKGQETKLLKCDKEIDAKTALKLEFESRSLPVVPLFRFNGNANKWLEFIEYFYTRVHCKSSLDHSMRMTYLKIAVDGESIICKSSKTVKTRIWKYLISSSRSLKIYA